MVKHTGSFRITKLISDRESKIAFTYQQSFEEH